MASKVAVVLESRLKHSLLVFAQPVDPLDFALVALPDVQQQISLLLEALLWGLHGDKRGHPNVARSNCGM